MENVQYSILSYGELKERISLNLLDSIILYFSSTAKERCSAVIAMFDSLIEENRRLSLQIEIWERNLEQIKNYTLDKLLADSQKAEKKKKYRYSIPRYIKEIELYEEIVKRKKSLLKATKEIYKNYNTVRLFSSLYECVNSGRDGIIMYLSDFNLDDTKIKEMKKYALNTDKDIIMFTEFGVDEYEVTYFDSNYKGVIIKKSCTLENAFQFINETMASNELTDTIVRIL